MDRFPDDFTFQLTSEEWETLRSQNVTAKTQSSSEPDALRFQNATSKGGRRYLPYAFTEQGVAMLSSVLRSKQAVQVNIAIMRAFVRLREVLAANADLATRLDELEQRHEALATSSDQYFRAIIAKIREMMEAPPMPPEPPKKAIGFTPGEDTGTKRAKAKKGRA